MSELNNVELAEFLRLASPLIVHVDDEVAAVAGPIATAAGRRPAGERRPHRRAPTAARPAGSGARRNERERNRVRQVNAGFDRLRDHVPHGRRNRKLSKVDTLRAAVEYITHLRAVLYHGDGGPTSAITDENYRDHGAVAGTVVDDDVIDDWYVEPRLCGSLERAPAEASMTSRHDDVIAALGGGSVPSTMTGRLTVDVFCSTSPSSVGSSFAGSAGRGSCATPESVDPEVTSSSGSGHLDDEAERLFNFAPWFS